MRKISTILFIMQNYLLLAALAAITAQASSTFADDVDAAVLANADDATISIIESIYGDRQLSMLRFTGDSAGDEVTNQWTRGPVLFVHDDYESCVDLISQDQSAYQLFLSGFDVFIHCRRGSPGSDVDLNVDEEAFWNYNIEDVGKEDITNQVSTIIAGRAE